MKAGVAIWLDSPLPDCVEVAVAAEDAGLSEVWLPDHYFLRDAYAAQALIAQRTSRVRLGTAVVSPLLRHPALLASATATINELSGGRAIIGIGVGGFEFPTQLGMKVPRPLSVVRDAVAIVRSLARGEANIDGEVFTARGARGPLPTFRTRCRGRMRQSRARPSGSGGNTGCILQSSRCSRW